jgi:hypothetical protein
VQDILPSDKITPINKPLNIKRRGKNGFGEK